MVSQFRCPYCGTSNIDWMLLDEDVDVETVRNYMVTCLDCHRAWYFDEVYAQVNWEMTDIEGNQIASSHRRAVSASNRRPIGRRR